MTTKPKARKGGTPAPSTPDIPFAVQRIILELLETWLARHETHEAAPAVRVYLDTMKGTNDAQ